MPLGFALSLILHVVLAAVLLVGLPLSRREPPPMAPVSVGVVGPEALSRFDSTAPETADAPPELDFGDEVPPAETPTPSEPPPPTPRPRPPEVDNQVAAAREPEAAPDIRPAPEPVRP
ncbi:MAG: cell envelope integrity protein TolA, partial [Azospirillaceae bacterium]